MEKTAHVLAPLHRRRFPSRFVFFDSESSLPHYGKAVREQKPHTPRLIVAEFWEAFGDDYRQREEQVFRGTAEDLCDRFWEWVAHIASSRLGGDRSSLVVVAHNIGYDVQATGGAARLIKDGWKAHPPYAKGPIFIWRFEKNRRTISLLSSTNWYAAKLKDVGAAYGIEKLDTDTQTPDMDELTTYCRRDTAICREAVLGLVRFLRDRDLGSWADTISSVAFKSFRYRFMRHAIELHIHPEATALERAAYHGGRTEAAFIGDVEELPVYLLDVNSLYPSVMLDRLFPTRLLQYHVGDLEALRATVETGGLVIADVDVSIERPTLPHVDDKLLFPVGRFRSSLCTPELEIAFREGTVHEVYGWAVYEGAPIFTDYVTFMYRERLKAREENREAVAVLFKYLMNCLYGKFGQRQENWVCLGKAPPDAPEVGVTEYIDKNGDVLTERIFGGYRWVVAGPLVEAYNSFPAIAAFVTSYARVVLLGGMRVVGDYEPDRADRDARAGREFYYCDTDSLFVSQKGYDRLRAASMVDARALGKFKLEGTATERVIFRGAKNYEFDHKVRRKGVPDSAKSVWEDGTPVRTKKGEPAVVYDSWPKLLTHLREGNLATFANRPVVKKTTVTYDKGSVMESGWVRPLRLGTPTAEEGRAAA